MSVHIRDFHRPDKIWVLATLGQTRVHGLVVGEHVSDDGRALMLSVPGVHHRVSGDGIWLWRDEDWMIDVVEPPVVVPPLPTAPGTVIAIGEWWLVRLRPYHETADASWELLPAPKDTNMKMRRMGIKAQCVYGDDWVRAEAEQHGGFAIVAAPDQGAPA